MNVLMTVFGQKACRDYLLPDQKNCHHSILLEATCFGFHKDIGLTLINREGHWTLEGGPDLSVRRQAGEKQGGPADLHFKRGSNSEEQMVSSYMLWTAFGEQMEIFFYPSRRKLLPSWKCPLKEGMVLGRDEGCSVRLQGNRRISRRHLLFESRAKKWYVRGLGKNGYYLNGDYYNGSQEVSFGDCVVIMDYRIYFLGTILAVDNPFRSGSIRSPETSAEKEWRPESHNRSGLAYHKRPEADSILEDVLGDGRIRVRRAPRKIEKIETEPINIEGPPEIEEGRRDSMLMTAGPMLSMMVPMLGGSLFMLYAMRTEQRTLGLSAYSGLVMTGLTLVFTLLWAVVGARLMEREDKKRTAAAGRTYRRYLSVKEEGIRNRYDMTRHILLARYPSAGSCMDYEESSTLLWARNNYHDDFLCHRLGLGEIPFPSRILVPKEDYRWADSKLWREMKEICEHYRRIPKLPILLPLGNYRQIGLIGESRKDLVDLISILAMQIAAGNCYSEVKLALFYDMSREDEADRLDFFRWLPHLWDQGLKRRYLAGNKEEARELAYELSQIFKNRAGHGEGRQEGRPVSGQAPIPYYILFILEPDYLEGEMLGHYIFEEPANLGLTVLWCVDEREKIPNSCRMIVEKTEPFWGMYDVTGACQEKVKIDYDQVDRKKCSRFARRLTRMYVSENLTGADIPTRVSFFALFGVEKAAELQVSDRWDHNRASESMRAAIGLKTGGQLVYLDLHENYYGPHGLVAGTTGSGKSEMLQTYILSMALNYSPQEVNFFLIDYKGGGMAGLFKDLPHLCGSISNLSGSLISRALVSIKSENLRRQKLFSQEGVNHINSYSKLFYEGCVEAPLPHLIIIIDEFAELKKEEPEFMKELISVAQVGRSLGVHLILATQKPAGTVSDNIWSNSRFRICLKVQDRQDSMEMIHRVDAASITQTGRGYLQVGNDELFELFQSGWSGAPEEDSQADPVRLIGNNGMALSLSAGQGRSEEIDRKENGASCGRKDRKEPVPKRQRTQLEAVLELVHANWVERPGYPVRSLWMEPLPSSLSLDDLIREDLGTKPPQDQEPGLETVAGILIGLMDDPENQRREVLTINPEECGHLLLCGSSLSGKSILLQTFLFSMMKAFAPVQMQAYVLDYGGGALQCFLDLPHLGGLAKAEEKEKTRRILEWFLSELDRRQALLQGGNYRQYRDEKGRLLPVVFLLIDSYGDFQDKTGQAYEKYIWRILKEGENCGLLLFVSARELSGAELPPAMAGYFRTRMCLSMKEMFGYMEVLGCISLPVMPETGIGGRGITFLGKRILEFQTALCLNEANDFERKQLICDQVKALAGSYNGPMPDRVRCVPDPLTWDDFQEELSACRDQEGREGGPWIYPGYDDRTARLYGLDLSGLYCISLTGSEKGRLNMMRIFLEVLKDSGKMQLILLDLDRCLVRYKEADAVKAYGQTEEDLLLIFEELTELFQQRRSGFERCREDDYYIFIITGFLRLMEMAYQGETGMDGFLENIWEKGRGRGIVFLGLLDPAQTNSLEIYRAFKIFTGQGPVLASGGSLMDLSLCPSGSLSYDEQLKPMEKKEGYVFSGENDITKIIVPEVEET